VRPDAQEYPARVMERLVESDDNYFEAEKYLKTRFETEVQDPVDLYGGFRYWVSARKSEVWSSAGSLIYMYLKQNDDSRAEQIIMKFIEWTSGDCRAQLDTAIGLARHFGKEAIEKRWREIDLEKYKDPVRYNNSVDNTRASWIVVEDDDSNDISVAFAKEINSYLLDSLPAPVRYEKRKNPQFAHLKPGWGLYDGKTHIIAYSEEPPSYDLISGMAKGNGIVSRIEEYERFKRTNDRNGHLEVSLLREYLLLANKRMARFNQSNLEKPMLGEEEDKIIWAPLARSLEEMLSNGRYRFVLLLYHIRPLGETANQSPIIKRLAARLIRSVEEMIKRDPAYTVNYQLWFTLNGLTDNKHSLFDTLSELNHAPGENHVLNIPASPSFLGMINKEAVKYEEWDFILTSSQSSWNYHSYWWKNGQPKNYDDALNLLAPYIEALLATGNVAEAEIIFSEFMDVIPSGDIQAKLAALASKWKKPELAKKWGNMRPNQ
jgi:hypothetical protein